MIVVLLILALAAAVVIAYLILTWAAAALHHGRHEQREQAAEAEAKAFVAELRGQPAPGKTIYTDQNVWLPRTPQLLTPSRQPTEAELDEWKARWLAAQGGPVEVLDDEDDLYDLCAGCRGHNHCDGAVETCCCTCGWGEDWDEEDENEEPDPFHTPAPDEDSFVSALMSLPVEDIDLAFSTGQFPAVTS